MATIPLGPDSAPVTLPGAIPPAPAVMAILDRFNREELGNTIEVLVALLDIWDGDPDALDTNDAEDDFARTGLSNAYASNSGPGCYVSDIPDATTTEWHTRGRLKDVPGIYGKNGWRVDEDAEDDDPDCGLDEGEPNFVAASDGGAGCPIADPGGCEHDGREEEHDMECEQMLGDVPMLPVVSADERTPLGISNLQSSFVGGARSADTGALHKGRGLTLRSPPGVPV
jgi:hypothetical protein